IDAKPNDPLVAGQVAELYRQAGMVDEAIAHYQKAIALAPENAQYREYLGEYYHGLNRPAEALKTWGQIASDANKTPKNLTRLAEVLAGFGYKKEAIDPIAEACRLEADDFDRQVRYADLLAQLERHGEALARLEIASRLAAEPGQAEAVLDRQIKAYQG